MGLLDQLKKIGCRLSIIQIVPASKKSEPVKIQTRSISLGELASEIRTGDVRSLAQRPEELEVEFDRVFETAGIEPGQGGWTIDRLRQVLREEPYKSRDRESVQKGILELLAGEKVDAGDLVKDAVARDQAMDVYETLVRQKMEDRSAARRRKIDELQQQCDRLKEENQADDRQWQQWHQKKVAYEKDLAWTVGFLLDGSVITIDSEA